MSSEQPRRARESAGSGSPLGSTAAIIIAIVAVVAGFLILRQIRDDDDDVATPGSVVDSVDGTTESTATGDTSSVTTTPSVLTTLPPETLPPTTAFTTEGAIVVVANASTVNGAAGQLTTALTGEGFDLAAATNATEKLDISRIYYNAANAQALAVASSVASLISVTEILEMPTPPPVEGGALGEGVDVLVMVGSDKAGKTLEQMGAAAGATATTAAGATATTAAAGAPTTAAGATTTTI